MGDAISICFKKYATFNGRAKRSEYWLFYLFYLIIYVAASIIDASQNTSLNTSLAVLLFFIPMLAVGCRRMHDVDKSGWFILIPFYNIVLLATEGTPSDNRFGSI